MLEDRFCIASGGAIDVRLSPEDMVGCDVGNMGCQGGMLSATIDFLTSEGVVDETCKPYVSGVGANGFCHFQCSSLFNQYRKYSCKKGSLVAPTSYTAIQTELMNNGPLQVGFSVYSDFMDYASGIYEKTSTYVVGGHAVKLIGWDHDSNGRLYWVC
jgi:cathepsin B